MSVSSATFVRSSILFLIVGFVALLGIVGMSLWLGEQSRLHFDEVIEARDARAATTDLRKMLHQIETGQRGYLLTMEESYLEPFYESRSQVMGQYEVLRKLLEPYPQAAEAMAGLKQGIEQKLEEVDETIALARDGRRDEAVAVVKTDVGKELMDEAQTLFTAIIAAADRRLTEGSETQRRTTDLLWWVTVVGAILIVAVVGGAVGMAISYTRELLRSRAEVERLNGGLEERVGERTVELQRANEEIQRFAYIVTHDLRAPLVNIMGFTSELEACAAAVKAEYETDAAGAPDEQRREAARVAALEDMPEAIGFIRSSTQKMDALINAILKLSREGRRPLKPERLDIEPLVAASVASVQHQIEEAEGTVSLDIGVPSIVCDRMALGQIFGNLLDNAVKYRERTRPLAVAVRTRDAPGRRIAIEVEDNGRGVAPQDHERIFELFRRSGPQDQAGEGIGLPHVRGMVRAMGGEITVKSELGHGSIFTIMLPKDLRSAVPAANGTETA